MLRSLIVLMLRPQIFISLSPLIILLLESLIMYLLWPSRGIAVLVGLSLQLDLWKVKFTIKQENWCLCRNKIWLTVLIFAVTLHPFSMNINSYRDISLYNFLGLITRFGYDYSNCSSKLVNIFEYFRKLWLWRRFSWSCFWVYHETWRNWIGRRLSL